MLLECLVDELLDLADLRVYNDYRDAPLQVKCSLLYSVCDFPAYCKVFLTAGQTSCRACPYCWETGMYEKSLSKVVHVCNRRFLDSAHPLRKANRKFPSKEACLEPPPEQIDTLAESKERNTYDSLRVTSHKKAQLKKTGFKGNYALHQFIAGQSKALLMVCTQWLMSLATSWIRF